MIYYKMHEKYREKYDSKTFCSETFRNTISTACVKTRGYVPYPWQLDATEFNHNNVHGEALRMDRSQVCVLEQQHQVCL